MKKEETIEELGEPINFDCGCKNMSIKARLEGKEPEVNPSCQIHTPQVEKPNKEEPSQIGGAEFHVFNSPSDKTLEAVVEDWNKQASELSETYEVEKPSVTSDKTWEERFDKLDIEYNWEIESPPRGRIKSFIQKELTSATIKAREQGYVERVKEEIEEEMVKIRELQEKIKKDFKPEEPKS